MHWVLESFDVSIIEVLGRDCIGYRMESVIHSQCAGYLLNKLSSAMRTFKCEHDSFLAFVNCDH